MATQTVISTFLAGRTSHSFRLRNQSTGAIVDTQAATETASGSGVYTAAFTDVPAGTYTLQFIRISDSLVVDDKVVTLTLTTATFVAKLAVELDSAASGKVFI